VNVSQPALILCALLTLGCVFAQLQVDDRIPTCGPPLVCAAPATSAPSPKSQNTKPEPKQASSDAFSELTLFLFGSGLALFVALLGWSDQIRGINKDTREMEERFLATTKIDRRVFLSIVKPESPDEQLAALTEILASGKPKTVAAVEVLQIFQTWHRKWTTLEALSAWKYRLSVILTYVLFAAGLISLFVNPHAEVSLLFVRVRVLLLILMIPMTGFLAILTIITVANYKESYFHELLNSLSEKV
jgi:hypothetical protein